MEVLKTPILLLVFSRPDTTQKVFQRIREVKPKVLYVSADGARPHKEGEAAKCQEVREIVSQVDWDCELHTRFLDQNFGSKRAVASAISWFFSEQSEGIILEDDCLPDHSFFRYCQELLHKYREEERIMHIAGFNPIKTNLNNSYYYSLYTACWGWASWSRAWQRFDIDMKEWDSLKNNKPLLKERFVYNLRVKKAIKNIEQAYREEVQAWDYQWNYSIIMNRGLTIMPRLNLIQNIGFGDGATHTTTSSNLRAEAGAGKMEFPLKHDESLQVNQRLLKKIFRFDLMNSLLSKIGSESLSKIVSKYYQ